MASVARARLIGLAFATFHTGLFFLIFVILAYANGALGGALASLNTLVGMAIFVLFWLLTWITGHQVLKDIGTELSERNQLTVTRRRMLLRGALWGGVEGIIVLSISLWVFLILTLIASSATLVPANIIEGLLFEGFALVVGSPFAFAIGAVVGLFFVTTDLMLLGIARSVFPLIELSPEVERGI